MRDPAGPVERIVDMLVLKRTGKLDGSIGVLSSHDMVAEGIWMFLEALLSIIERFSCIRWSEPRKLCAPAYNVALKGNQPCDA